MSLTDARRVTGMGSLAAFPVSLRSSTHGSPNSLASQQCTPNSETIPGYCAGLPLHTARDHVHCQIRMGQHCSAVEPITDLVDINHILAYKAERTLSRSMLRIGFQSPDRVKVAPEVETSSSATISRYPFRPCKAKLENSRTLSHPSLGKSQHSIA